MKILLQNILPLLFFHQIILSKYIWYYLAQAYYKVQKYDKALEACNQSLKINRNFDKALKFKEKILSTNK